MKRIYIVMLFAALATITYAQTDDKGYQEGAWVLKGVTGLNMSQTAMANWSAGGENSIAGNAYLNASLTHKKGNWLWVTNMVLDYGLSKTKSQGMRKSSDKIGLSTQLIKLSAESLVKFKELKLLQLKRPASFLMLLE